MPARPADISPLARSGRAFAVLLACAMALALALPFTASASPLEALDLTLLVEPEGSGEPVLLIAGRLAEETPLPAEIVLPVPENSTVVWAGEILGTDVSQDVPAEARIEERDGANVAIMTVSRSRVGQIEVTYPEAAGELDGWLYAAGYRLTAPVDVEGLRMAVALPPGSEPSALPPGTLSAQGPQGDTYYYQEVADVSTGDPVGFIVQFSRETVAPEQTAGGGPFSEVPPLVIALFAAAAAGLVLMLVASRSRARTAEAAATDAGGAFEVDEGEGSEQAVVLAEAATEGESADTPVTLHEGPEADDVQAEEPIRESKGWFTPQRLVLIVGVLGIGLVVALILGGQEGQVGVTQFENGWITQRISTAAAESTVELNAIISCDCPPESEGPKMFDALRTVPGVAYAELEEATLLLRVQYDSSVTDEDAIATALKAAGYLP